MSRTGANIVVAGAIWVGILNVHAAAQVESGGAIRERAADRAYDLEHDKAIALLRGAVAAAPDDAALHRSLASVLWLTAELPL